MHRYRTIAGVGAAALTTAMLISPVAQAAPSSATTARTARTTPPVPTTRGALVRVQTRHSLLGTHTWYAQTFHGLPVLNGYYARHTDKAGHVTVDDGRLAVPASLSTTPTVAAPAAAGTAKTALTAAAAKAQATRRSGPAKDSPAALSPTTSQRTTLAVLGGAGARLVWQVTGRSAAGSIESVVDASTGKVLSQRSLVKHATGKGTVFSPNPVAGLHDENLTDQNDSDAAVPAKAYRQVTLTNLGTSGTLRGTYARIMNANAVKSSTRTFTYKRHAEGFEQVGAYYDITQAQLYLRSLGFTDVNAEAQKVETNTIPDDNSFYDPSVDLITFGRGGVDDAEDQEVVWHELGHAIQDDQVPGFGESEEGGAIGEAFGDYWAVTMSEPVGKGFDVPCVMDWDATSYTDGPSHCLRRVDGSKTTDDIDGEVHDDGEIWSRALWDIHNALGRTKANKVIIESQFGFSPTTTFAAAAQHTVQTARVMYGADAAAAVKQAFVIRKILG